MVRSHTGNLAEIDRPSVSITSAVPLKFGLGRCQDRLSTISSLKKHKLVGCVIELILSVSAQINVAYICGLI